MEKIFVFNAFESDVAGAEGYKGNFSFFYIKGNKKYSAQGVLDVNEMGMATKEEVESLEKNKLTWEK